MIKADHPPLEDHVPCPGNKPSSPRFIISASCYRTVPLFSATFRVTDIIIRNSSGCRTSANFMSAVETKRLLSCSGSTDVGVALGDSGLHEGSS